MANQEPVFFEAARTVAGLSGDERFAEQYRAREEYYLEQLAQTRHLQKLTADLSKKDEVIAEQDKVIAKKDEKIAEQDKVIAEQDKKIAELTRQIAAQSGQNL